MGPVPFQAHVDLLLQFQSHRAAIVERILELLNAQGRAETQLPDRAFLFRQIETGFFSQPGIAPHLTALRGQLREAHRASGFRPSQIPRMHNDVVDPAEMGIRGMQVWRETRWPGRNGRLRFAHTLFNLYVLQCLELLSMRLWDADRAAAGERLARLQAVLDSLWQGSPADQPVLVRDARWLIPLAQSPANEGLAPYFEVAEKIDSLPPPDQLEIHRASVQLAGGHLRSQLRHYMLAGGESLEDLTQILRTRRSNALDFSMLIQGLVVLLGAYDQARRVGDERRQLELADAILQGVSADPELFLNRIDLLGPYSMVEFLFIATEQGATGYTPTGARHLALLRQYAALVARLAVPLHADSVRLRPVAGSCSPYGVIYGFSNNLVELMAIKAQQPDAVAGFSLEDAFTSLDPGAARLAWVSGWRRLPHVGADILKLYEYPQQFAELIFERIERALGIAAASSANTLSTGRLYIGPVGDAAAAAQELPVEYVLSSDTQVVAERRARICDQQQLLHDRYEGEFLVSYPTAQGWTAITKDVLTEVLGAGRDARLTGLPAEAEAVLRLMCLDLAA